MEDRAAIAQAWIVLVGSGLVLYFGIPMAIGGMTEGRLRGTGCATSFGNADIWGMIFGSDIGNCRLHNRENHDAWILRNQVLVLVVMLAIALLCLSWFVASSGPYGAEELLPAILTAVVALAVGAVVVLAVLFYLALMAMYFMTIVVIGLAFASAKD